MVIRNSVVLTHNMQWCVCVGGGLFWKRCEFKVYNVVTMSHTHSGIPYQMLLKINICALGYIFKLMACLELQIVKKKRGILVRFEIPY